MNLTKAQIAEILYRAKEAGGDDGVRLATEKLRQMSVGASRAIQPETPAAEQMSHPPTPVKDDLPPEGEFGGRPLTGLEMWELGKAENPEEMELRLKMPVYQKEPGATVYVQTDPGKWAEAPPSEFLTTGPGFGRALGEDLVPMAAGLGAGILAGAGGPPTWAAAIGYPALAAFVAKLGEEGVEQAQGLNTQSLLDVGLGATGKAAQEGLGGAGGKAFSKLPISASKSFPFVERSALEVPMQADQVMLREAQDLIAAYPELGEGVTRAAVNAVTEGSVIPSPMWARMAGQTEASTWALSQATQGSAQRASSLMQGFRPGPENLVLGNRALTQFGQRQRGRETPVSDVELGSRTVNEAANTALRRLRGERSAAYQRVDKAADAETPEFDLTPVRNISPAGEKLTRTDLEPTRWLDEDGKPIMEEVVREIAAQPSLTGKVDRFYSFMDEVDPKQMNWRALKDMRTALGDSVRNWKTPDAEDAYAIKAYNKLTEIMKKPTNVDPETSAFVQEFANANRTSREFYRMTGNPEARQMLEANPGGDLFRSIMQDPVKMLDPNIRDFLGSASPRQRTAMVRAAQQDILASENPVGAFRAFDETKAPGVAEAVLGAQGSTRRGKLWSAVEEMNIQRQSAAGQAYKAAESSDVVRQTLDAIKAPSQARAAFDNMTTAERSAMRNQLMENLVTKSLSPEGGRKGAPVMRTKVARQIIEEYRRRGLVGTFLPEDTIKDVRGIGSYWELFLKPFTDMSSNLEGGAFGAQIIESPLQAIGGNVEPAGKIARMLTERKMMGRFFANQKAGKKLLSRVFRKPRNESARYMAGLAASPLLADYFLADETGNTDLADRLADMIVSD